MVFLPVYEYVCTHCDERFDALVRSFDQADMVSCPECSDGEVRRLVSSFATFGGLDDPITPLQTSNGGGCCGGSCGCGH